MGQEKGEKFMSYLNSVTIIGFVGADPEQRQARNNEKGTGRSGIEERTDGSCAGARRRDHDARER
jgi:single-stranded DNA-binding protein